MGFVVLTTPELKIKNILYNDTTFSFLETERLLTTFVSKDDRSKLLDFVQNIKDDKAEFGYEVHIQTDEENILYNFSGIKAENGLILILASQLKEDIVNQYDHFMKVNNQYLNKIRRLLKNQIQSEDEVVVSGDSSDIYNQISQINNDLMDVQRELTKTNKELKWQKERYFATLKSIAEAVIALNYEKKIDFINQAAKDLLDVDENIKGKQLTELDIKCRDNDDNDILKPVIEGVCKTGNSIKKEDLILQTQSKEIPIDLTLSPIEVNEEELVGVVIVIRDITLKKKHEEKLRKLAVTDRLTDIMNRRMGIKYLDKQIERVKREKIPLTVCFVDVNGLKKVNDNYGHLAGDELLKNVAQILQNNIRNADAVARMGGDEFLMIFSNKCIKEVEDVWARIEKKVDEWNINTDKPYIISLSHGFAQKEFEDGLTSDELIEKADSQMYKDKQQYYNSI
uniref:Diguanylate cyclase and metal dependent phosphohydrolase n=1 Tax=uncultured organism TaxID=155900 RepID=M1PQW5_9ZZZZ|nr:diguanylate cyclase and metal dependent phosphohydrolase [uncultured organism]